MVNGLAEVTSDGKEAIRKDIKVPAQHSNKGYRHLPPSH